MTAPSLNASSAMPSGTRLGEFEITGVIGEGGFGIVYSARDSSLDRIVAIKEYLPSAFASRTAEGTVHVRSQEHSKTFEAGLASFINEARMLAKFSHPGLVEVFRFWEGNGTAYMAMRYYRGVTLRELLRTNPQIVTEQWLCETLDPILLALQELHNEKCYHRDIAPDNILVLPNGRSVLMDFGAARRIIGGMTRALTTVLKPGYAPIEQYSDDGSMAQGAWTDIYAVGGLLYHAMTGKVPVQAISRMMNDPLKSVSTAARAEFSPTLCSVVMKCLAVMPENRYQSIDELRAALGWVTTPVSSTVVYQRTVNVSNPIPVVAEMSQNMGAALPTTLVPNSILDVQTPIKAGHAAPDVLADLLGTPSKTAAPALAAALVPAATVAAVALPPRPVVKAESAKSVSAVLTPSAPPASSSNDSPKSKKSNALPIAIISVAVLAVVGSGIYLFSGKPTSPAQSTAANSSAPSYAPSTAAPTPPATVAQPDPVVAAAPPVVVTPPVAEVVRPVEAANSLPPPVVTADETAAKNDPLAAPVAVKVDLRIKPWGAISVNGVAKGVSPPTMQLQLMPGTYSIEIQNPAGATVTKTIEVVAGKPVTVRHAF
jgi:serine/threonine protein kinase